MNVLVVDTSPARAALDAADAAYTLAVQAAVRSGDWVFVREARRVVHEARAALLAAGGHA